MIKVTQRTVSDLKNILASGIEDALNTSQALHNHERYMSLCSTSKVSNCEVFTADIYETDECT